jgi:hypothetical protein
MFNPFNEVVLTNFLKKLEASSILFPRTTYFVYASPVHQKTLLNDGYAVIYQKQKMHLNGIITVKDPGTPAGNHGAN